MQRFLQRAFQYFGKHYVLFFMSLILLSSFSAPTFSQQEIEVEDEGISISSDISSVDRKLETLNFRELCKTPEGKQYIFDKENDPDLKYQWEGLKAQNQTTAKTFEEYKRGWIDKICQGSFEYEFLLIPPKMTGDCTNPSFGPPYFDVEESVESIKSLDAYYRTIPEMSSEERKAKMSNAVNSLLEREERKLFLAYQTVLCEITAHGECWGHTGQKRTCGKTRMNAPSGQEFLYNTLDKSGNVYVGPVWESPTYIWFRVGKTGHGMGNGYVYVFSRFMTKGAKNRASADVDAIRRKLIALKLPVDRIPEPIPVAIPNRPVTNVPATTPANLKIYKGVRPNNPRFFDVRITNTGGSPATVSFRICSKDAYFTISKETCDSYFDIVIKPGRLFETSKHEWTPDASFWRFEIL
jgi:hypothetical protein